MARVPHAPGQSRPADAETALQQFVAKFDARNQRLISDVRAALRRRFPAANELVWDNYNFFVIGYSLAERLSDAPLSVAASAKRVSLCFVHGARLADPSGILLGSGKQTRFVRLDSAGDLDRPELEALLWAAVADARSSFQAGARGKLIIRAVSEKQRARRKAAE